MRQKFLALFSIVLASVLLLAACTGSAGIQGPAGPQGPAGSQGPEGLQGLAGPAGGQMFTLTSSAYVEQGIIPVKYSGGGENVSPALNWANPPEGTMSFALAMIDPDIPWGEEVPVYGQLPPPGTMPGDLFSHWILVDISASVTSLAEGASVGTPIKEYGGPGPPPGTIAHTYILTLYALDVESLPGVSAESDYLAFTNAMAGHVLATATLTAYFGQ